MPIGKDNYGPVQQGDVVYDDFGFEPRYGKIDVDDLWGQLDGDLNNDGVVNGADLDIARENGLDVDIIRDNYGNTIDGKNTHGIDNLLSLNVDNLLSLNKKLVNPGYRPTELLALAIEKYGKYSSESYVIRIWYQELFDLFYPLVHKDKKKYDFITHVLALYLKLIENDWDKGVYFIDIKAEYHASGRITYSLTGSATQEYGSNFSASRKIAGNGLMLRTLVQYYQYRELFLSEMSDSERKYFIDKIYEAKYGL